MYPKNITLVKENTLDDAEYPQRETYPDGYEKKGLMWEHTLPMVGKPFLVMYSKIVPIFSTSRVMAITEVTDSYIRFRTRNSNYKILIEDEA